MLKEIVIIGGGIAGYSIAERLSTPDNKITLIEKSDMGGTCLNRGCIPMKSLIFNSKRCDNPKALFTETEQTVKFIKENLESRLKKSINLIQDTAAIESEEKVFLEKSQKTLNFDTLILATGSKATIPEKFSNVSGAISYEELTKLEVVPKKLLIVGAGYIGLETATLFKNLGSEVVVIEKEAEILPNLERDIVRNFLAKFNKGGIKVILDADNMEITEGKAILGGEEIEFDKLLFATGREPNQVQSKIKVKKSESEPFSTNFENIFMIGDCYEGPLLAHKAENDAQLLARKIREGQGMPAQENIPYCIFTEPQIASAGSIEETDTKVKVPFGAIGSFYCKKNLDGFVKVAFNEEGIIKGAQIIGKNAADLISPFVIMVSQKLNYKEIEKIIFPHPTDAEIIKEIVKQYSEVKKHC